MDSQLNDLFFLVDLQWQQLVDFLDKGGVVLFVIMTVSFALWLMIIERVYYFIVIQKHICNVVAQQWMARRERRSWYAEKIRLHLLSLVHISSQRRLSSIRLIVIVSPLLGLLGTVLGMIEVFDVMAATGASNSRAMAAGVSKATIPTMAGMVVSLSGLLFSVVLQRRAALVMSQFSAQLAMEEK